MISLVRFFWIFCVDGSFLYFVWNWEGGSVSGVFFVAIRV